MKRHWIVLTLFILALIIGATGCINDKGEMPTRIHSPTPVEREFRLTEWRMIDDNGRPALQIAFTNAGGVYLTLTDPDGIEVGNMYIQRGVTGGKLYLRGDIGEIPKAGQYRLIVREYKYDGEIIATETLSFEGAKATISDAKLTWGYWTQGYVYLKDIKYNIRNDGDIPVYIRKCKLVIGDKEISSRFGDAWGDVPPGDEKTICTSSFVFTDIIPGEYAANLELRDGTDKVVCSYSFVVAPAVCDKGETPSPIPSATPVEREFRLTEWRMIDANGLPALQIAFTSAGAVQLTLTDPDGIVVDRSMPIPEGVTGAKLHVNDNLCTIPKAGQYRLIVREYLDGEIIATETLSFEGAKATISDVKITWGYWTQGYVYLKDIRYNIRNDGDIPIYSCKCKLVIGDKEGSSVFADANVVVLPGDEKTIRTAVFIADIIPGEYAANLELKDGTDKVVCSYSFAVAPAVTKESEFKLTQWELTESFGKPALRLRFTLYENIADLYLTNPDGVETDSESVMVGMNEITLCLAGYRETPDAGQYIIIAKDSLRNIVAKDELYFEGAEATISNVELTWDYRKLSEDYSLERISFIVSNNGDLPAYIYEARIAIGEKMYPISPIKPFNVFPGEKKTIEEALIFAGITSGDKEFTLELKDITGKVVCSYSRNVTPTE